MFKKIDVKGLYLLPLYWLHVSTPQGYHQAFFMNQLILESCVNSWDPNNAHKDKCKVFVSITIRLATCFDPTGLSLGFLYEPITRNIGKLRTFVGFQQCLQR
jgi:hypothetical protein